MPVAQWVGGPCCVRAVRVRVLAWRQGIGAGSGWGFAGAGINGCHGRSMHSSSKCDVWRRVQCEELEAKRAADSCSVLRAFRVGRHTETNSPRCVPLCTTPQPACPLSASPLPPAPTLAVGDAGAAAVSAYPAAGAPTGAHLPLALPRACRTLCANTSAYSRSTPRCHRPVALAPIPNPRSCVVVTPPPASSAPQC